MDSNKERACVLATNIFSALDSLNMPASVSKDDNTTVAGNSNAHESIELVKQTVEDITATVGNSANNLKSVASEFEAMDKSIRSIFNITPFG
ncbi:TIGR04197 family type VII secretion effector [Enterococcus sp. BWM-S5]|uniref:TIGR04197 family type VII secretion effector n=1 Tax=Enterococcus larvae TaxID=2794352 RepID=A0ABS4CN58_9ENTE|nr:TIGR04197 family type VII secretion effector [Enterococcus larvae]MBP1047561.1 TIGR04197 family type VII secretion effector [Enterococcus larvae]